MELILKSNNKESIAKIVDLARELNVFIVRKESDKVTDVSLKDRIFNFKSIGPSSFGDAAEWEKQDRADRDLPFE